MVGYMSVRISAVRFSFVVKDKMDFISQKSTAKNWKRSFCFLTSGFVHLC